VVAGRHAPGGGREREFRRQRRDTRQRGRRHGHRAVRGALPWNAGGVLWHCDGRNIIVAAGRLWRIAYPGGAAQPLTHDTSRYSAPSASADCRTLAALQENQTSTVWVAPDGRSDDAARRITEAGYNHGIAWFPDGRLAYESEAGGNPDVWVVDADGGGACG